MISMNRRRFLAITAATVGAATATRAGAVPLYQWRGQALGSRASITLKHPDAERIAARAAAEIARLENVFSLFRTGSELSRLNATGRLQAPSFELLDCLSVCGAVHAASGGLFDPTIQPLWASYAEHYAVGSAPDATARAAALALVGWASLRFDADLIHFARPGMALTLNGVAQGYIADRVADLLAAEGLTDILVDTGEMRALGGHPDGGAWPVTLDMGGELVPGAMQLRDRALASSAPLGTVFDAKGRVGHILNPLTGLPAVPQWRLVSVTAPKAGLADALSTAFCLMPRADILRTLAAFPQARLLHLA
jgi:thiamine biosynthesis lipoprotein